MIRSTIIKKRHEFSRIFRCARSVQNSLLIIYIQDNHHETVRSGICVAKKVGGAVERNRVRRRLREVIRTNLHRFARNIDIVIVARYPCKDASYQKIQEKFVNICVKAGIMTGN